MSKAKRRLLRSLTLAWQPVVWSRTLESLALADHVVVRETPTGLVALRGSHRTAHPY